jgi:hypothetical protein
MTPAPISDGTPYKLAELSSLYSWAFVIDVTKVGVVKYQGRRNRAAGGEDRNRGAKEVPPETPTLRSGSGPPFRSTLISPPVWLDDVIYHENILQRSHLSFKVSGAVVS